MKKNKLSDHFGLLSDEERTELGKFIIRTKGGSMQIYRLYESLHSHITRYKKRFKEESVEKSLIVLKEEKIWNQVFGDKYPNATTTTPKRLTSLYSDLVKVIREFLNFYDSFQDELAREIRMLKRFNQKGYEKYYTDSVKKVKRLLDKIPQESSLYWHYKHNFHQEQEKHHRTLKGFGRSHHLLSVVEAHEYEYLINSISYWVALLNRSAYFNLETKKHKTLVPDKQLILNFEQKRKPFIDYLRIRIQNIPKSFTSLHLYYLAIELYEHENPEPYFHELFNNLNQQKEKLSESDTLNIRHLLLNYTTKRIRRSDLPNPFEMYGKILEELLSENKKNIDHRVFINFCVSLLRSKSIKNAYIFINEYKDKLDKLHCNDISHYCTSLCHLYNGQFGGLSNEDKIKRFKESLDEINKISNDNTYCVRGKYTIIARCYIELSDINITYEDRATSYIHSACTYFDNLDSFIDEELQEYKVFFKILKRIWNLVLNTKINNARKNRRVKELKEIILSKNPLHKEWLLDKIKQRFEDR